MKIKKVSFENFYSYEKCSIDFRKHKGIVGIEGINKDTGGSNGAGKSVILEAIVYGLFGKSIRKSTEDAMVNSTAGRGCVVELEIDEMTIRRARKPSMLKFFINGEEHTQGHASRTQELIEQKLGVDYKTFMAAAVFGQHSNVDFLDATPDDKRKIINRFLSLDYIFDMKNKIKGKRSDLRTEIKEAEVLIDKLERDIEKYSEKVSGTKLSPKQQKVLEKYTLDQIIEWEKRNTQYSIRMDGLKREINQLGGPPITKAKKVVRDGIGSQTKWKCGECGTQKNEEISEDFYNFCKDRVDIYEKKVSEIKEEIKDIQGMIERLPCTPREYAKWTEQKNEQVYRDLIIEARAERTAYTHRKTELENQYDIYGFWDKAFSEKGLVRFVIRTVRDYLNTHCNYYLGYLTNGRITVEFDEELREYIEVTGKHRHYISLSGGERRKVNLAVMLGLQTLLTMSNGHQSSVLFFDEVAENLDEDGINGLYDLLCDLKKDKTLFVITHNPHLAQLLSRHKKIIITKQKGVSTIK